MKDILCLLLFSTLAITLNAQVFDWKSYKSPEQVNDLVDTGNTLIMATDAGLVRLDKTTLEKEYFTTQNSNLPHDHIQSITMSPTGSLWIGTYDVVLARFDGNDFTDITTIEGVDYEAETTELYDVEHAPNGDLWVGTSMGAFQRHDSLWTLHDGSAFGNFFQEIWDIEISPDNDVYLAGMFLHHLKDGVFSNMTDTTILFGYGHAELFLAKNGDLFFTGSNHQIGRHDGTQWTIYSTFTPGDFDVDLGNAQIHNFTENQEGDIFFTSTSKGFFKLISGTWTQQQNLQTDFLKNKSSYLYIDHQGRQWLNHSIYLTVTDNGTLIDTKIAKHTIEKNSIWRIRKDAYGTLYFINRNNSVATLSSDGSWSALDLPTTFMSWESIYDLVVFESDDLWIITTRGLYHFDGTEWVLFEILDSCRDLAYDTQRRLYIGTTNGLYVVHNGVMTHHTPANSPLTSPIISGLGVNDNDDLWIVAAGNVYKISNGNWTTYSTQEYPEIIGGNGEFHFDQNGNVWMPTWGNGAVKFDGTTWQNYNPSNSLMPNTHVYSIESDLNGKVYFSHGGGILTLEENTWVNTPAEELPMEKFYQSNLNISNDGTLWWSSDQDGVYAYTSESPNNTLAPLASEMALKIYPNPSPDLTILDFEVTTRSAVQAIVFNAMGQIMSVIDFGMLSPQEYQESINLTHFPKGIYTIQLIIGKTSLVGEIIIN